MWTDATFLDVVTLGIVAERVVLQVRKDLPPIPVKRADNLFSSLVNLLLARDTIQRAEATVDGLARPSDTGGAIGPAAGAHYAYVSTLRNSSYSLDAALSEIEAGHRDQVVAPDVVGRGRHGYLWPLMMVSPRGEAPAFPGRYPRTGDGQTSVGTKAMGERILAAYEAQCVAGVDISAPLAAEVNATFAAKRAELLAIAQQWYPERAYT